MSNVSIGIVGGGLLGLSVAYQLTCQKPGIKVRIYEKENDICTHQSGNNSGVLHCGLYYKPGSLKAHLAVSGIREMVSFCKEHAVPHEICGKVVVASDEVESKRLQDLAFRGEANGLRGLRMLSASELREREPYVRSHSSLLVPEEGIVDFSAVGRKLVELIRAHGGEVQTGLRVRACSPYSDSELVLNPHYSSDFYCER